MGAKAKGLWACTCWLTVAWTAACGGGGGGTTDGSGGTTSPGDSTTTTAGAGGGSGGGSGSGGASTEEQCYPEETCSKVDVITSGASCEQPGAPMTVPEEDAARCVLEQLRDGKPGQVSIDLYPTASGTDGPCGLLYEIHILEGRDAIVVSDQYLDLVEDYSSSRATLRAPAFYQQCLDDGPPAYPSCLGNAFSPQPGSPTCACLYCN